MTRNELYNKITPCGTLDYPTIVYLINNVSFHNLPARLLLMERVAHDGRLSQSDWILFARSINFLPGSTVDQAMVESWLAGKCNLTRQELKLFLEGVSFTDGSLPTYILSQSGDFIIAE